MDENDFEKKPDDINLNSDDSKIDADNDAEIDDISNHNHNLDTDSIEHGLQNNKDDMLKQNSLVGQNEFGQSSSQINQDDFYKPKQGNNYNSSSNQDYDFFASQNSNQGYNQNGFNNNNGDMPKHDDMYGYLKKDKMPKWLMVLVSIIVAITVLLAGGLGGYFIGNANLLNSQDMKLTNELYKLIDQYYYEDISREDFDKAAALGVSSMLDQFSGLILTDSEASPMFGMSIKSDSINHHYITNIEEESSAGNTLGVSVNSKGEPTNGSIPAAEAHMMKGDLIILINGVNVKGLNRDLLNDETLLGAKTSSFVVERKINGVTSYAKFNLTKGTAASKDAYYHDMGGNVGMIDLNTFAGEDASDFIAAAEEFTTSNNNKLILDLRDNGGGAITNLATIATYLIDNQTGKKLPVVRVIDKNKKEDVFYTSTKSNDLFVGKNKTDYELVVLINGSSASASEGLVGALRGYMPETTIVGEATYGKGVAQIGYHVPGYNLILHLTIGYFDVPTATNGIHTGWMNFHKNPMQPTAEYDIPSIDPYNSEGKMLNYYNNDITNELAYIKAMEALGYKNIMAA